MLKHIKKIYSDLTEFFLVLLTGLFAGSIFTLAYIKYWDTSKVSFADIGGMLAGVGTMGLLFVGLSWKKQISYQNKLKALSDWYIKALSFNRYIKDVMKSELVNYSYIKGEIDYARSKKAELNEQISATKDIEAQVILIKDKEEIEIILEKMQATWIVEVQKLSQSYNEIEKQRYALEDAESILLSMINIDDKKKMLVQLSSNYILDNIELGAHDYEHQFQEKVIRNKNEINQLYNKLLEKQL